MLLLLLLLMLLQLLLILQLLLLFIMLLLLTVVGIRGEGNTFGWDMTDEMPFGVRTVNSDEPSPAIILVISGVDRAKMGVTKLGGWFARVCRGLVKSKRKSLLVFSMLLLFLDCLILIGLLPLLFGLNCFHQSIGLFRIFMHSLGYIFFRYIYVHVYI